MTTRILPGDALAQLRTLPEASAHLCVTSPPYFQQRDYKVAGQIGLEATWKEHLAALLVADRLGRDAIGIELNPAYVQIARARLAKDAPLFNS